MALALLITPGIHSAMKTFRHASSIAFFALIPTWAIAQVVPGDLESPRSYKAEDHYQKVEYQIPMRDGVKLHTTVYQPKDDSQNYPILLKRTPYSCRPYGENIYPRLVGPSQVMMEEGYIVVYQDVRGRYMSEGLYDNMRPHRDGDDEIDESSDTYDTIDWLLEHLEGHNGKVGMWGISYPGFYVAAALPEAHPALVAASPQAPIADFYFDDFHHRGAFTLAYFLITRVFSYQKDELTTRPWYPIIDPETRDGYQFYLDLGPLKNASQYYADDAFFWQQLVEHPDYDDFWQSRTILPHLNNLHTAVMTVGGWFDAEDLYGPLNIYKTIEGENPGGFNMIVMGPWSHGDWSRDREVQSVGNISFGTGISRLYQEEVEARFFHHFLKGEDNETSALDLPEAFMFDTGRKEWQEFDHWPPQASSSVKLYFDDQERLQASTPPGADDQAMYTEYQSDPAHPVPYTSEIRIVATPRAYMPDDQRFASRRPDVASFRSEILQEDVTLAGPISAKLHVSTTGTDADWIVKLIDIYPNNTPRDPETAPGVELGGYEQLVRSEIIRGRYRNSFEEPEAFEPGVVTEIELPLQDVFHTFKKGHRILVHVQSSWFPLFDRNPQTFVPNIFKADQDDFVKQTQRVYHSPDHPSHLEVLVIPNLPVGE